MDNAQESIALNYLIRIDGTFPSRNLTQPGVEGAAVAEALTSQPTPGEILLYAGSDVPEGYARADGSLLSILQNQALFSILGLAYGGSLDSSTFGLPDFRGRTAVGAGPGPDFGSVESGQGLGTETSTLSVLNLPAHAHDVVPEPTSLALLGVGGRALAGRRRRA